METSPWNIQKLTKMGDEEFDQAGGIDLYIEHELFYEMLRSESWTRPGNYPVQQEIVLG